MQRTILASAARTATQNPGDRSLPDGYKGAIFTLDITAVPGTVTVQLVIEAKDATSGKYVALLTDAAQAGITTRTLVIFPGVGAASGSINGTLPIALPGDYRVRVVHSGGTSFTYSVGEQLLPA